MEITLEKTVAEIMKIQKKKDVKKLRKQEYELDKYFRDSRRRSAKLGGYFL